MLKAVIFDVDGTLVDSVDLHAKAWVDAFREIGHDFKFDVVRSQIGKGGDQLMPGFLSKQELEEKGESLSKRRGEILKQRYLSKIKAFPNVRALFELIKADGTRIVLASSAKADKLKTYKKIANIDDAEAAAKAGLQTIGVLCGGFSESSLREARCIAIYKDPTDLLGQYDRSPLAPNSAQS
jgi:phosphoglycolate phosphatase-like HAD superfamily hydrolase